MAKVTVTSNTGWGLKSKPDWITVTPTSGSGNGEINISATPNTEAERHGDVVLETISGALTAIVNIIQEAGSREIDWQLPLMDATEYRAYLTSLGISAPVPDDPKYKYTTAHMWVIQNDPAGQVSVGITAAYAPAHGVIVGSSLIYDITGIIREGEVLNAGGIYQSWYTDPPGQELPVRSPVGRTFVIEFGEYIWDPTAINPFDDPYNIYLFRADMGISKSLLDLPVDSVFKGYGLTFLTHGTPSFQPFAGKTFEAVSSSGDTITVTVNPYDIHVRTKIGGYDGGSLTPFYAGNWSGENSLTNLGGLANTELRVTKNTLYDVTGEWTFADAFIVPSNYY